MNIKPHAIADANGRPLSFFLTAGQVSAEKGATAVIPNTPSVPAGTLSTRHLYCKFPFSCLKQFRRVATRFEKAARNYFAVVTLADTIPWLR